MQITIVHFGGTRKVVALEDITPQGWIQVRYPNGGGCYSFSLVHGRMETKRGVEPEWHIEPADFERLKALAAERKIKPKKQRHVGRARSPRKKAPSKQEELFND